MQLLPSQPVSIGKILDISIKLYAACFTKLTGFFMLLAVFYILMSLLTGQITEAQTVTPEEMQAYTISVLPKLLGVILVFSLLAFIVYNAIIYRVDSAAKHREDSFPEALQAGIKKFPAAALGAILYTIAVMIGTVLLVVPGLILSLSLAFYLYFIVLEDMGSIASLKSSHSLVWGHWWRTIAVFTAPSIVMLVVFLTLGFISAFLGSGPVMENLIEIAVNLLSALITPYFFVLSYVQYNDLKLRKSGSDLESRLAK